MVTWFNRKELITVMSAVKLYEIKEALAGAGIEHYTGFSAGSVQMAGRYRGMPGITQDAACTYRIYVKKKEYHRAVAAMQEALRTWKD